MDDTPRLTDQEADRIIQALKDRGAESDCPRCGHDHFNLEDGYFIQVLQSGSTNVRFTGQWTCPGLVDR